MCSCQGSFNELVHIGGFYQCCGPGQTTLTAHPRNQAITAVAHRLLELVWHVLTRHQPYRHFSHERIAYKYLTWAWKMDEEARDGLTRQQFARYYLIHLGIGHDLTRIALDPKHPRKISSEAELLALRPELQHLE